MKIARYVAAAAFAFASAACAQPVITQVLKSGGSTAGGDLMYLMGTFPAGTPLVVIGGHSATVLQSTTNSILCMTPAGVGAGLAIQVNIAGQNSNTMLFSYDIPTIQSVNPFFGPTSGFSQIAITGENFGTSPIVTIGGTPVIGSMTSPNTFSGWTPAGQGVNLPIVVDAGGQTNITTPRSYYYNSPTVSFMSPNSGNTQGGTLITLSGSSFGITPYVRVGSQIVGTNYASHTQIGFVMPAGAGTGIPVSVIVGGLESNPIMFSYNRPAITSINPPIGPTAGGTEVELLGTNFGPLASAEVLFDGLPVSVLPTSLGQTSLRFRSPAGTGTSHTVTVRAAGQTSISPTYYSYLPAMIQFVVPQALHPYSSEYLVIGGENFGLNPQVRIDGALANFVSASHTVIVVQPQPHAPGTAQLVVRVNGVDTPPVNINFECNSDFNGDGAVDFFDYLDFVDAYSTGC